MISYTERKYRTEGPKGFLVLFTKNEKEFEFITEIPQEQLVKIKETLELTDASEKDTRTIYIKENSDYDIICAAGIKKDDLFSIRKAGSSGYKVLNSLKCVEMILPVGYKAKWLVEGAMLASFEFDYLKKEKKELMKISPQKVCEEYEEGSRIAYHQNFARFLGEMPANLMTPTIFAERIKEFLKDKKIEFREYGKEFAQENNMNLFLSVSQGSNEPLKFLHLSYRGKSADSVDVALVGKGVTFDSGGISIKPSSKMEDMKLDMMGAATICSAISLICEKNLPINVDCFIPLTENLPSGIATKPGDVFFSMKGVSVEVENTDAEGRLILADAMTYAQKFKPTYMIDVATLTGAIVIALGSVYTGLFSNCDNLSNLILQSGNDTGDLCWRMPLDERFKASLESIDADIKNAGDRKGSSSSAASFLNVFVEEGTKWAHLDIAGSMNGSYFSELYGKGASGIPLNLLYEVVKRLSKTEN
ncbi:hypothetical protein H312_03374 [Anncaliia algerae PRA339]|uniref:leucyl aminopeptidase n=1 Tax=Anncaliia algerae PRA339 TaxID=1288291 RepID=A0A059EWH2_9MICR|nr:hypothetical protein H312_03374 [Anncaliia algerae PRA339]